MVDYARGDSRKAIRDRALSLFGFASATRRRELVALEVEDLQETDRGLLVAVRRSKTDQEGREAPAGYPRRPQLGSQPRQRPEIADNGLGHGAPREPIFAGSTNTNVWARPEQRRLDGVAFPLYRVAH